MESIPPNMRNSFHHPASNTISAIFAAATGPESLSPISPEFSSPIAPNMFANDTNVNLDCSRTSCHAAFIESNSQNLMFFTSTVDVVSSNTPKKQESCGHSAVAVFVSPLCAYCTSKAFPICFFSSV